tara:strand:+ start:258 stop:416 length:159 start_codon:yes stop_codon:yes gene_type:complete
MMLRVFDVLNPTITEGRYTILGQTFTLDEEKGFIEAFPERGVFSIAVIESTT